MLDDMNNFLIPAMRERGVVVVDMRRFGADVPPNELYVDAIHPRDELYTAVLYHAFAAVCGDEPPLRRPPLDAVECGGVGACERWAACPPLRGDRGRVGGGGRPVVVCSDEAD